MNSRISLAQFYIELQEWLDQGRPPHLSFNNARSTCLVLMSWASRRMTPAKAIGLCNTHDSLLEYEFGEFHKYPFNFKPGARLDEDSVFDAAQSWASEQDGVDGSFWTNERRLAWVKKQAEYGAQVLTEERQPK